MRTLVLCAALSLALSASASETGHTTRDLEMRAEPKAGAAVVGSLAKGARFELLKRQMSWAQVSAEGKQGWVLFFYLLAGEAPKPAGGAAFAEAWTLGTQRAAQGDRVTATLGVRGIDEEQLRSARFNAEELKRLEAYAVPAQAGESFAQEVALSRRNVSYLVP
jgi:hypothetical protein